MKLLVMFRGSSEKMTPSQQAKAEGLKSLSVVSELTGVSLQTLTNWHKDKPDLFRVVLAGCKFIISTTTETK
jgi:hypothetical protein